MFKHCLNFPESNTFCGPPPFKNWSVLGNLTNQLVNVTKSVELINFWKLVHFSIFMKSVDLNNFCKSGEFHPFLENGSIWSTLINFRKPIESILFKWCESIANNSWLESMFSGICCLLHFSSQMYSNMWRRLC